MLVAPYSGRQPKLGQSYINPLKPPAKGGSLESIEILIERLYEKINAVRTNYTKFVRRLLNTLREKGYMTKKLSPTKIPEATDEDDVEEALDALLDDMKTGPLVKTIDKLPPLKETLSEFKEISEADTLKDVINHVKKNHSTLNDLERSFRPIMNRHKARPAAKKRNPMMTELLKQFS